MRFFPGMVVVWVLLGFCSGEGWVGFFLFFSSLPPRVIQYKEDGDLENDFGVNAGVFPLHVSRKSSAARTASLALRRQQQMASCNCG